jgi:D-alanyl-lipoteichoic acid acyltransferase DltB (MBOAT superfamily)
MIELILCTITDCVRAGLEPAPKKWVLARGGIAYQPPHLDLFLPIGISFYTFESISYNLDIYFGRARPAIVWVEELSGHRPKSLWARLRQELKALNAFACYITQFPHLVAGPIIRYQDLERQIHLRSHTVEKFARGVFFFALGLSKKVLIANPMGDVADAAFETHLLSAFDAWYGLLAYAFQIYFDFSGYSDMAIGLGLMVGFEFNKNFDSPYKSQSITEFWRRWHISLSTWLRDYLYVQLGGNRRGALRTYGNLMAVMLLGGLWHGASWNFLVWGGIHGAWLSVERIQGKASLYARSPAFVRVAVTFFIVNLAWVFFRAPDLAASLHYLQALFGMQDRDYKRLLKKTKLYSRTVKLVHREAEGALLALQLLLLLAAEPSGPGQSLRIEVDSPRRTLLRLRGDIAAMLRRLGPRQFAAYLHRLAVVRDEPCCRRRAKSRQVWPRRKEHKPPKAPKMRVLTAALKRRIAKHLKAA